MSKQLGVNNNLPNTLIQIENILKEKGIVLTPNTEKKIKDTLSQPSITIDNIENTSPLTSLLIRYSSLLNTDTLISEYLISKLISDIPSDIVKKEINILENLGVLERKEKFRTSHIIC